MSTKEELLARNRHLNALLENTRATLEEERKINAATKTRIPGGFYLMNKLAEKNLRDLQIANPTASLVFSVIREHMQIGTNAITISNAALCKIIGKSRSTITRAISHLSNHNYVQIIKVGTTNTYVVNEQIAFAGTPGQRKAVFSATVVAHEIEQEKQCNQIKKLKSVPIVCSANDNIQT